jgi:hypothetical protein
MNTELTPQHALLMAAINWLDFDLYLKEGDDDGADGAYESYLTYLQHLVNDMRQEFPLVGYDEHMSYATGMVDGFVRAMRDGDLPPKPGI